MWILLRMCVCVYVGGVCIFSTKGDGKGCIEHSRAREKVFMHVGLYYVHTYIHTYIHVYGKGRIEHRAFKSKRVDMNVCIVQLFRSDSDSDSDSDSSLFNVSLFRLRLRLRLRVCRRIQENRHECVHFLGALHASYAQMHGELTRARAHTHTHTHIYIHTHTDIHTHTRKHITDVCQYECADAWGVGLGFLY